MTLLILGTNHRTASLDLREAVAFSPEQLEQAHAELVALEGVDEAVIVSTCNRTELYLSGEGLDAGFGARAFAWLAGFHRVAQASLQECFYQHVGDRAARHLMRVACGLDSMVLGEPQILGQIKGGYQLARRYATLGGPLEQLFQYAFSTAKQVRTETGIGENPVSVAYAAVNLAGRIFDDLSHSRALLIGAGETIDLVARHLREAGIQGLIIANRTQARAERLAAEVGGVAVGLEEVPQALSCADIVITSTASPLPVLGKGAVESALKVRRHRPIFMVDIAVPRDIEPEVGELDDVFLYTVDDLNEIIDENRRSREVAATQAESMIDERVDEWHRDRRERGAGQLIRRHRRQAEALRQAAEAHALAQLERGENPQDVIRRLSHQLTNKLLHGPTARLRAASGAERQDIIAAAEALLLDEAASDAFDAAEIDALKLGAHCPIGAHSQQVP
ncbi:glutamyl-tRNA reductase [Halotalea alkalilenta]|uniref:Glutamyl-tRNA reductase n=1 Tax=Halotalea alkalilenta TaxID=376489 RepID=A0A172YEF3_9GAMM|nr:glutamyl-tRNA reductase [Halotalea alkalilenta]ANF57472.1 glutamyl-tRNA reductase [Halotalea alkalilenta]